MIAKRKSEVKNQAGLEEQHKKADQADQADQAVFDNFFFLVRFFIFFKNGKKRTKKIKKRTRKGKKADQVKLRRVQKDKKADH